MTVLSTARTTLRKLKRKITSDVGVGRDCKIIMHYSFYIFSKTNKTYYNTQSDYLISTFEKFAIFPSTRNEYYRSSYFRILSKKSLVTLNYKKVK